MGLMCDSLDEDYTEPPVSSKPTITPRPTPTPVPTVKFGAPTPSPNAVVAGPSTTPAPAAGAAPAPAPSPASPSPGSPSPGSPSPGSPSGDSGGGAASVCSDNTCGRCSCNSNGCQTADGACDCFPDFRGQRCEFYYPFDLQHTITLNVVQGVRSRPGRQSDAHRHGRPRYWRSYDWSDPNVQTFARDACAAHAKHPHLKMRREDSACIVELFEVSWLAPKQKALPLV